MSLAAVLLFLSGCAKNNDHGLANVLVHVSDFSISQEDFAVAKSQSVGSYNNVKAITLAFYRGDGTQVYKHTQFRSDNTTYTTFGEFSCSLPLDSYTMVVLGYGQESTSHEVTLTGPTAAGFDDFVRETFCTTQAVTVNSNAPLNLTATLDRIIAKVSVVSTDGKTANVHAIRTTFGGGSKSFNPTTGLATDNNGFANTVVTGVAAGNTTNIGSGVFLLTDEQTMDLTVETLDSEGNVIFSKVVPDVPLRRNRITTLTGAMYTAGTSASGFQVNSEWLDGNTFTF